ncbi:hypothetical protein ACIRRA_45915 [Nocardia sp. NPDC101769]|uniref:hypothetical protein n=1 Tax=Nocardia sp. NPDC101769 TaxID=3364333 RepID=UPI0038039DFA
MSYYWTQRARTMAAALGITPADVTDVLYSPAKLVMNGTDNGTRVLLFWARTSAGRPLIITLRADDEADEEEDTGIVDYLIRSVYDMQSYELGIFAEWEQNQ